MDKNRDRIIKEIFASALEIEDAARRTRYLAEACAGDLELQQEVESLLGAYTQAGQFLQSTPAQPASTAGWKRLAQSSGATGCWKRLVRAALA